MRPVLPTDLLCAARVVMRAPPARQGAVAQALLDQAETADVHRRQTGQAHPRFGDGTLAMAARNAQMAPERVLCDPDYAAALIVVLRMILRRRRRA